MSILEHSGSDKEQFKWQDGDDGDLETHMTEIAIQVVLSAEVQYREGATRKYEWRVARKAELEELRAQAQVRSCTRRKRSAEKD